MSEHRYIGDCWVCDDPDASLVVLTRDGDREILHDVEDAHSIGNPAVEPKLSPPRRREQRENPDCATCQSDLNFQPAHKAMDSCRSGKHNHCTCDTCF